MAEEIHFGSKSIKFDLAYANRKTLGITVTPSLHVIITAPYGTKLEKIKEKVIKKAPWIIKQQTYFLSFQPKNTPRKYVNGETHLYLGRQYRLKIISGHDESVKLKGAFIEVTTKSKNRVKALLNNWYLHNAQKKFSEIAIPFIEKFKKYKVNPSSIVLREMPKRWGSCTPKGKIILNPDLIRAPKACIEYVIIHELCHLIYHEHSKRFFDLQSKEMQNWEKWKFKLDSLLA